MCEPDPNGDGYRQSNTDFNGNSYRYGNSHRHGNSYRHGDASLRQFRRDRGWRIRGRWYPEHDLEQSTDLDQLRHPVVRQRLVRHWWRYGTAADRSDLGLVRWYCSSGNRDPGPERGNSLFGECVPALLDADRGGVLTVHR